MDQLYPPSLDNDYDPRYSSNLNLEIVHSAEGDATPQKITHNGVAPFEGAAWSPDSQSIAFSDRDQNGVPQIYLISIATGKITLLTEFRNNHKELRISKVQFSPDGQSVAFIVQDPDQLMGVIHLSNRQLTMILGKGSDYHSYDSTFWWSGDSRQILLAVAGNEKNADGTWKEQLIAWYDAANGKQIKTFPTKGDTTYFVEFVFPIADTDRVGFLAYKKGDDWGSYYWLYDASAAEPEKIDLPFPGASPYQFVIPRGEIDLSKCSN